MKIAIIGTGIAGNLAAYRLAPDHDITVFEADHRIGGHTNTIGVDLQGSRYEVDTGFIVFNDRTYPNFVTLLDELGVASQDSEMSFSVRCERTGLEYNGASMNSLFAQRRNLFRPSFHRMLRDILRFNRQAPALLGSPSDRMTLNEFLQGNGYSREFIENYIVPMGSAIWSSTPEGMTEVPAGFFIRFFYNHGLLSLADRPTWRVVTGGSHRYVEKLVAGHADRIRLNTPVRMLKRHANSVEIRTADSEPEFFDRVFLACHSDQALALLADPTKQERQVLGAIAYQKNEAVLHTDHSMMPVNQRAWASWNYHIPSDPAQTGHRVALTYNMNILQGLKAPEQLCVSLNHSSAIDPAKVIGTFEYAHPVFTEQALSAQQRQREINGCLNTYYCGAWWRYGFHEDGVVSTMNALQHLEQDIREGELQPSLAA